jgi:hypothetical protein
VRRPVKRGTKPLPGPPLLDQVRGRCGREALQIAETDGTRRRLSAFSQSSQRRVKDHRRVVRRHSVGHRIERFVQVLDHLWIAPQLGRLQGIPDHLGDLAGRDLLVARPVGSRVRQGDGAAYKRRAWLAAQAGCSARLGPTTTRRSGSSPMLMVVTSGSASSARWIARRSNGCMASSVIGSPVTLTWRAAR